MKEFNPEQTQDEEEILRRKVKPEEAFASPQAEKSLEQEGVEQKEIELSPEIVERVMEKVQDINQEGTGFHCIGGQDKPLDNPEALETTLKFGILGFNMYERDKEVRQMPLVNRWHKEVRKEKTGVVYANIVGRDILSISSTYFFGYFPQVGIIFDVQKFQELFPAATYDNAKTDIESHKITQGLYGSMQSRSFRGKLGEYFMFDKDSKAIREGLNKLDPNIDYPTFLEKIVEDGNLPESFIKKAMNAKSFSELFENPANDDGFYFSHRIPPRLFLGVVVHTELWEEVQVGDDPSRLYRKQSDITDKVNLRVKDIIKIMQKMKRYFPIYDHLGNLIWPEQMSYPEVKRFVAERDKKTEEESTDK